MDKKIIKMKLIKSKLSKLIINYDRKRVPLSSREREKHQGKYPYYGATSIMDYIDNYLFDGRYILFGEDGTVIDETGHPILQITKGKFWCNNHAHVLQNTEKVDFDYLYYLLKNTNVLSAVTGAVQPKISQLNMNNIDVEIFEDLVYQRKIASILSVLDEKIEVNTAISRKLEEVAREIFKEWFVNFGCFGGKMPTDWKVVNLNSIAYISSGKRPYTRFNDFSKENSVPIIGATSIIGFTNAPNYDEKILITGRVGTHGVVQRFNKPCWASDNTLVIKSNYYEYTYQILKQIDYSSLNRGSTQPLITQGDMNKIQILLPNDSILIEFEDIVGTLMQKYELIMEENEKLSALRDTLLPRLLSGEIDVSSLEI